MLMSMAYLDQILPVSSTVEAVEVTRRASMWSWVAKKTLPTDVASPCVHCFREAGSCVSGTACVSLPHASLYRMRLSRVRACVFLVYAHDTPPRVFSTLVLFIMP